jgi:hypothetical protein
VVAALSKRGECPEADAGVGGGVAADGVEVGVGDVV